VQPEGTTWHDVQLAESKDGAQELIIENLESLNDKSALILTRHGNSFKIGITSDDSTRGYHLPVIGDSTS
jgi:hypothetical protein